MDAERYQNLLAKLGACPEARHAADGKSLAEVWKTCERGDWMLWLAARVPVSRQLLVLAACDCVEPSLQYTTDPRPAECIAVARRWALGEATNDELQAAARAAARAAGEASLAESARLVRSRIPLSVIEAAIEALDKERRPWALYDSSAPFSDTAGW
jgi:hypothetical protein